MGPSLHTAAEMEASLIPKERCRRKRYECGREKAVGNTGNAVADLGQSGSEAGDAVGVAGAVVERGLVPGGAFGLEEVCRSRQMLTLPV